MRTILFVLALTLLPTAVYLIRIWFLSRFGYYLTPKGRVSKPGELVVRASPNGAFRIQARINGAAMACLVDTGANYTILNQDSARAAGFDVDGMMYDNDIDTANGVVHGAAAEVMIEGVTVGPIEIRKVKALVSRAPLAEPLLGMTFLNSLGSFEIKNGKLTMRA